MSIKKRLAELKAQQEKKEAPKPQVPVPGLKTEGDKGLVEPPQRKLPPKAPPPKRKPAEDADSDAGTRKADPDEAETSIYLPEDDDVATKAEQKPSGKAAGTVIGTGQDLFAAMERASGPDEGTASDAESIEEFGSSQYSLIEGDSAEEPSGQTQEIGPSAILDVQDLPVAGARQTMDVRDSEFEEMRPIEDDSEEGEVDLETLAAQARSSAVAEKPQASPAPAEKKAMPEGTKSTHWLLAQMLNDKTKLRLGYTAKYTGGVGAAREFTLLDPLGQSLPAFSVAPGESKTVENLPSKEGPLTITVEHTEKGLKTTVVGGRTKGDKVTGALKTVGTFLRDNSVAVVGMVTGTAASVIGVTERLLTPWLGQYDVAALGLATGLMLVLGALHIRGKYKRNDNTGEAKGE